MTRRSLPGLIALGLALAVGCDEEPTPTPTDAATDVSVDGVAPGDAATDATSTQDTPASDVVAADVATTDAGAPDVVSTDVTTTDVTTTDVGARDVTTTDVTTMDVTTMDVTTMDVATMDVATMDVSAGDVAPVMDVPGCNSLSLSGAPSVELVRVAEGAPTLGGGAVVAGTYRRTAWSALTGVGGATGPVGSHRQSAIVLSEVTAESARIDFADRLNDGAVNRLRGAMTWTGGAASFSFTCPAATSSRASFAALTAPVRLVFYNSSNMQLETYTLDGEDAGAPADAGGADASTVDAGCVAIAHTAPVITTRNMVGAALPTAAGGALRDGRYHLTDVYYTRSATVRQQQLTLTLTGADFEVIDTHLGEGESRARGRTVVSGNTLRSDTTCPVASTGAPILFTATDTTLTLIHTSDQRVEVLTRQ